MELVTNFNKVAKAIQEAKAKDDTTIKLIRVDFEFHYNSDYCGIELPKCADEFKVTYDNSSVTFNCLNGYKYSAPICLTKFAYSGDEMSEYEARLVISATNLKQCFIAILTFYGNTYL
jgi:hypothetical protein